MFELVIEPKKEGLTDTEVSLGVRVKIAGHEVLCPVTKSCGDRTALELEVKRMVDQLEAIKTKAGKLFESSFRQGKLGFRPDMTPPEIWAVLSGIKDESEFVQSFNSLDETMRRKVAEHVLTRCNIFSGKAAVFSSRYDDATGVME
ncbi:MAG: hypothetical protein JW836_02140 [Deltaproteobacteria bacterium]|nr:hypothetical protein [Deltaproteobacteria bacterium]